MRILPTLLCALGTVSALDINAFMAKLKVDHGLKTKDRSGKKSDRRNSAPDVPSAVQPSEDQSKSAKKLARKSNRSTQPPATTKPRPTTTRPQPVTTRRVPPTRRVVGKRPIGKRPVYRRPIGRQTGRPIAAGKATRRPTVRGRFRPVTRGTTQRPRVTSAPVTKPTQEVDIIAPEVLARRHFKAPSVLSAGGRLFGYRSLTDDIVEKEKVTQTPFPSSNFEIAVKNSQVFSARQWTFGSGRSNLATSCWTCQGRSYSDCLNNGSAQTCGADQSACFVREYTQSESNIIVYMGCQNMFQCVKDFNNNSPSVADGRGTQPTVVGYERYGHYSTAASCVPGVAGSVCHQCCAGSDNCNSSWATTAMSTINEWTANSHTQNQT